MGDDAMDRPGNGPAADIAAGTQSSNWGDKGS